MIFPWPGLILLDDYKGKLLSFIKPHKDCVIVFFFPLKSKFAYQTRFCNWSCFIYSGVWTAMISTVRHVTQKCVCVYLHITCFDASLGVLVCYVDQDIVEFDWCRGFSNCTQRNQKANNKWYDQFLASYKILHFRRFN